MSEPKTKPVVIHSFSGKRHYLAEFVDPENPPYKGSGIYGKEDLPALCDPNTFGRTTEKAAQHQAQWVGGTYTDKPTKAAVRQARLDLLAQPFCQRCDRKYERLTKPPATKAKRAPKTPASTR